MLRATVRSHSIKQRSIWIFLTLLLPALVAAADDPAPEGATGYQEKQGAYARKFMVAAANPLAVDAGYQILKAGGSAVDAAIATQMVLALVEPQSSGLGGGAFLLHFDGNKVQAYDGRETAPRTVDKSLFFGPDGKALGYQQVVVGGRAVGVPGVLRMLAIAHDRHGKLPWTRLFASAIELATDGFPVSARLHAMLAEDRFLKQDPAAAAYFYDGQGRAWPVGHRLKNPPLAQVFKDIARGGAGVFYQGAIARAIAAKVQQHPTNPGRLTAADIAGYRAIERTPVCTDYRRWTICGIPPPSSGGISVAQMLGILESRDIGPHAPKDGMLGTEAIHLFSEAGRLAYADRGRYVADTDFAPMPGHSFLPLLDKGYLAGRASLIGPTSMGQAKAGLPFATVEARGADTAAELPSTTHFSIVDAHGQAVSMTSTVESAFGSRLMVHGFLLNNQLTDFSRDAVDADGPVANRIEGGKRPRSAMAPTLVFEKGTSRLVLATGSPGGSSIINYVAKVLVGTLDWGLDMQQAINLPNIGSRNGATEIEQGRVSPAVVKALQARGHTVRQGEQVSGLQGIMRMTVLGEPVWFGGADPRREGVVKGD